MVTNLDACLQVLPQMTHLNCLMLENNDIDNWALQVIITALLQPGCRSINTLDLAQNRLTKDVIAQLVPLIHEPPRAVAAGDMHAMLTELVLAGNAIGDAGAVMLFGVIGTGDSPVKVLDVSRCGLGGGSAGAWKALMEGAR